MEHKSIFSFSNSSLNIWITPDVGNDEPKVEFAEPRNNLIFPVDACVLEKKSSGTKNSKINERNIDYDDSSTGKMCKIKDRLFDKAKL